MVHNWHWAKPWGGVERNEAGEMRGKTCILMLPLPPDGHVTVGRLLQAPKPQVSPF